jgi:cytochrome P450
MSAMPALHADPFDEALLAAPFANHGELHDAGPVVWLEKYQVYAMARFAEVQSALRDHETFCSGRGVGLADFSKEEPFRQPSRLPETDPPLHSQIPVRRLNYTLCASSSLLVAVGAQ